MGPMMHYFKKNALCNFIRSLCSPLSYHLPLAAFQVTVSWPYLRGRGVGVGVWGVCSLCPVDPFDYEGGSLVAKIMFPLETQDLTST